MCSRDHGHHLLLWTPEGTGGMQETSMWDQHTKSRPGEGKLPPPPRALWRLWHLLSGRVTTHLKEGTAGNTEGSRQRWALSLPSGNTDRPAGVGATKLYSKEPCEKEARGPWTEPQGGSSALRPWGWDPSEGMRTRSTVLLCTSAAGKHKTQAWATRIPGRA